MKIEKGREPNVNDERVKKTKRKEETVTRERFRSPSPIGEDPQIEVSEEPLFSPPTKVLEADEDYVPSLDMLTAQARTAVVGIIGNHEERPTSFKYLSQLVRRRY